MATRFWYANGQASTVSPSFSAGWDLTTNALRRALLRSPSDTAGAPTTVGTGSANTNRLVWQHISDPMPAQIISGTVKGQARVNQTNAAVDQYFAQMCVYVVSSDGSVVRGTCLALHNAALSSEWAASLTNRKFPLAALSPATLTAVQMLNGDRLVIERGWRQASTAVANGVFPSRTQSPPDLAENETATGAANDWVEFSTDLQFVIRGSGASVIMAGDILKRRLKQIKWRG